MATPASVIYYRLIALWVLCEAMLGSIIFTFRIPVSGLVIGSCAVVCISLIAWFSPSKGSIIKATIIVAIFKMMLTPQAPAPAYIAVFFQGLLGELLFWNRKYYRIACIALAVIALLESAFQRVIVVTVVYGSDVWAAINQFLNRLAGSNQITDYSYFIILWYVLAHIIAGVIVGVWAGFLPARLKTMNNILKKYLIEPSEITEHEISLNPVKKKRRLIMLVTWIVLLVLYIQSFFKIGPPLLPDNTVLRILIRSVIIVLTWHFVVSPVLKQLLHKWLQKKKQQSAAQVQQVLNLLPATKNIVAKSWKLSAEKSGLKRIFLFCQIILVNTFNTAGSTS